MDNTPSPRTLRFRYWERFTAGVVLLLASPAWVVFMVWLLKPSTPGSLTVGEACTIGVVWLIGTVAAFVLIFTPTRWFCPFCNKRIAGNEPWVCGYCDKENGVSPLHSFLNKCWHCKAKAKIYACPHCGHRNFLGEETADDRCVAKRVCSPVPPVPEETDDERRARQVREAEDRVRQLQGELKIKVLEKKLETITGPKQEADPIQEWAKKNLDVLQKTVKTRALFLIEQKKLIEELQAMPEFKALSEEKREDEITQIGERFSFALGELDR